ncbi:hypothetical protein AMS68_002708 [Peltaster fructicola]|uniref:Chromatin modification-related protein EAF3 n=1 Tax=Peltaster fructicola TaxID=286661 RepID=A0A6H0XRB0_9PEZI|nr:hypothetical protein AMS68_002708 [Peltaster fructicola]
MAPSGTGPMYADEERVLCFHMELLYEAKVLESKLKDPNDKKDGYIYKVHYKGWKNTWDDWVPQERIRKFTDENRELAQNLKKEMDAARKASAAKAMPLSAKKRPYGSDLAGSSGRGSEDRSSVAPPPPRGTKRGREIEGVEKEEDFYRRPAVKIFMPDALKSILVDDWEKVTKERKLPPLPSPAPVTKFLNEYEAFEMGQRVPGSADADILEEVIAGVKEYFNKALGRILLYKVERQQYFEIHRELEKGHGEYAGKTLCDVYGCEHLLRLFVSLPDLIGHTNMDAQAVSRLREEITKMLSWLSLRIKEYLSTEYQWIGNEDADPKATA